MSEDLTPIQKSPRVRRARSQSQQQPGGDASPSGQSGDAGGAPSETTADNAASAETPAPLDAPPDLSTTIQQVKEEFFPGAKRVSGGVLQGLAREARRRMRKAEKGY